VQYKAEPAQFATFILGAGVLDARALAARVLGAGSQGASVKPSQDIGN